MLAQQIRALRRALHVLSRPVRAAGGGGLVLQPYRGYGSREQIFVIGRAFRQPTFGTGVPEGTLRRQLIDLARRMLRRGMADAVLVARFQGSEERIAADRDGYFRIHMPLAAPPPRDRLWHRVRLELLEPAPAEAEAWLFVPPDACRFVVISDIDDTVMDTGVASRTTMLWRLFMEGPRSRIAFPGMAAFLRGLHRGQAGAEGNPMLYVSRGPWSIYEVLDEFFALHDIPVGPILFLREWGMTFWNPLPRRAENHKLALIRNMLELYRDLPFVLIGDSGQRDPEIYVQVVREHPGRVRAIYIRNVSRDASRRRAIDALAEEVAAAGSALVLADDSFVMAEHAAGHALVSREALPEILAERQIEGEQGPPKPTRRVAGEGAQQTREAVRRGEVDEALDEGDGEAPANNVVVEPKEEQR